MGNPSRQVLSRRGLELAAQSQNTIETLLSGFAQTTTTLLSFTLPVGKWPRSNFRENLDDYNVMCPIITL